MDDGWDFLLQYIFYKIKTKYYYDPFLSSSVFFSETRYNYQKNGDLEYKVTSFAHDKNTNMIYSCIRKWQTIIVLFIYLICSDIFSIDVLREEISLLHLWSTTIHESHNKIWHLNFPAHYKSRRSAVIQTLQMPSVIYYSKNIIHSIEEMYFINKKKVSIYFNIINVFHMGNSTKSSQINYVFV